MDQEQNVDCALLKIKERLNQNKVKLWLTPYYTEKEGSNEKEMKVLASICSSQLSIPIEVCLEHLYKLQRRALENFKEQSNYRSTGVAALKVKVPSEQGIGKIISISMKLSKTGIALKEAISKEILVPVDRLKVIFYGKILKDDETLEFQGVKHGLHVMAIILENKPDDLLKHKSYEELLEVMKNDVKLLADNDIDEDYLQVADQSGKLLNLPENEKTSLILAMALHEKGRAAIKRQDFALALVLLLEAEKEFRGQPTTYKLSSEHKRILVKDLNNNSSSSCSSLCNSDLLKSVDNYGLLNLDIVWCYLNLQSITQLPDAEQRLKQCEISFHQSYGPNLERLIALKGSAGTENALFTRLHLLQAIVLYHQNKFNQCRELLEKVEHELKYLEVDDFQLSYLVELGYGAAEARLALRQSKGDLNLAVSIIEQKRLEIKKNQEAEKVEKDLKKEKKKLGKCINGDWIEPQFHKALMSMGYSYEVAKWALAQSCNSICNGVELIQKHPELLPGSQQEISDDLIAQVSSLGFEPEIAKLALKKHGNDIDKAIQELIINDGAVLDSSESSSSSDGSFPSTSQREHEEAYTRVSEGISNSVEDHLDLSLTAEKAFLEKYKDLLSKWKN